MVINAKKFSDVVLVYDQYYAKKPKAALLILERVALCSVLCLCAMMFVLAEYNLQLSPLSVGVKCVLFSAGFSLLFVFVKKRFAIPAVLAVMGIVALFTRERITERIPYMLDAFWLLLDGRFVPGKVFAEHDLDMLSMGNFAYYDAVSFGFLLIVFLFCMVTAACLSGKTNVFPSLVLWILLWVPMLVSEKFTFSVWLIPALAMYMGAFVPTTAYGQGIALGRGNGGSYREAAVRSERSFSNAVHRAPYVKQVQMRTVYYSKYFSAAMYVAAVFAVIGLVAGNALSSSEGLDYTKVYDFVKSLGENSPITNPFDKRTGTEDWFTDPETGTADNVHSLSITNPGRGNQRILSVKNTGNTVVYLRGDIGIDFTGDNWTSPINDEPKLWKRSGLSEFYRPVEMQILDSIQSMSYSDEQSSVNYAEITVDYLRDSKVTFLPAYTYDFGYFDNKMFNIYGDFVARVDESYKRMDSVNCTALVPDYTNMDDSSSEAGLESLRKAAELAQADGGISDIINGGYFTGHPLAFEEYREYVRSTYMDIPGKYRYMISVFSADSGLDDKATVIGSEEGNAIVRSYRISAAVADYLRSNFTYSLDVENDKENPLYSFLNETKSGHCAMYASSMVLILRNMGIPARYCTGFVVKPNGGEPTVMRSKNLHAWVEVYLDELGWVTFDPTSSSQMGETPGVIDPPESTPVSSSASSEDESSDSSDSDSEISEKSDGDSQSGGFSEFSEGEFPPDKPSVNVLPYILIILAVIAVILLVVLAVRYYKNLRVRAFGTIKKIRAAKNTDMLLEKIHTVMRICGVTQNPGELPNKFYARAEKAFGCSIKDYKNVIQAAAFGSKTLDTTECARLAGLLERLYEAAEKKLDPFGRIRLRLAFLSRKTFSKQ